MTSKGSPALYPEDRRFIKSAMASPLLERETEAALAVSWRDHRDENALHQLTEAHMRLVVSMAVRFRHYGLPTNDLIQEGMVGLMQAAERFDPDREVRFSTYAGWWIRAAIQEFVLRNWSIVRTGTTSAHKSLFFNLRRLRAKIDQETGESLGRQNRLEIARRLNVSEKDVDIMSARLAASDRSLNMPVADESDAEWMDLLADERALPEDQVMLARDRSTLSKWLNMALKDLTEREYTIIRERRLSEETVTLEKLGEKLGISKERVRQIESAALSKLKVALETCAGDEAAALAAS